jgi:hypothetical protein
LLKKNIKTPLIALYIIASMRRLFIIAALCVHPVTSFINFRSRFSKNLNIFNENEEIKPSSSSDFTINTSLPIYTHTTAATDTTDTTDAIYTTATTDIYDETTAVYDETTAVYDETTATYVEQIIVEITETDTETATESDTSEPKIIYIEFTPEEYKEYYIAVSERRHRLWDNIANDNTDEPATTDEEN